MSDNPVSLFVGDHESAEAAKADFQKLEHLHHKATSALFALTNYSSPIFGAICVRKTKALDTASSEPRRAEYS